MNVTTPQSRYLLPVGMIGVGWLLFLVGLVMIFSGCEARPAADDVESAAPTEEAPRSGDDLPSDAAAYTGTWQAVEGEYIRTLQLNAEGTFVFIRSTDEVVGELSSEQTTGTWQLRDGQLQLEIEQSGDETEENQTRRWKIESYTEEELVLRPLDGDEQSGQTVRYLRQE